MRDMKKLGERVRAARLAKGLSLNDMRTITGIDAATISKLETSSLKAVPKPETLIRIGSALPIPVLELLELAGHIPPGFGLTWEKPKAWRRVEITHEKEAA